MGNCAGCLQTPEEREARARTKQIDRELEEEKLTINRPPKILLLGEAGA